MSKRFQKAAGAPGDSNSRFGGDRSWLSVMAAMILAELGWWALCWKAGIAPEPWLFAFLALAFAGLAAAFAIRRILRPSRALPGWPSLIAGTALTGIGASLFLPVKYAIPKVVPFWLDGPLATAERQAFGADPWLLLDRALGWLLVPVDRIYGVWLPVQALILFAVMLEPPSRAKSRALIAYCLGWFVLGVAAATVFSSAGPIFDDRLFGGAKFAALGERLHAGGAWMALGESDRMYASFAGGRPGLVAGISAFPSLHVAISLWIYLTARSLAPRAAPLALCYVVLMWAASVQLGWHYASDGLAGLVGMLALWFAAAPIDRVLAAADSAAFPSAPGSARPSASLFSFQPYFRGKMSQRFRRRYLDLLGSIYLYNEHRGYTAIDRVLQAVRLRWPDDHRFIARIETHRADERKHYMMFRSWFERRGVMPLRVDRTCGHIDRFVAIMFRSRIDDLDPIRIVGRDDLFERLCRVISLTEKRGHRQVLTLLRHPIVAEDRRLMKIFRIIEQDEPGHWAPYDAWLESRGRPVAKWWERAIDHFIHSELLFLKLPILFLNPRLKRRIGWLDEQGHEAPAAGFPALASAE